MSMSIWAKRAILTFSFPVEEGLVVNFDDWEKLLHNAFYNDLRLAPEEHLFCCIVAPHMPAAVRAKMVQIAFETFNVPGLLMPTADVLAAYPARDALVLSSGYDFAIISHVANGISQQYTVCAGIGGKQVDSELKKAIPALDGVNQMPLLEEVKQKLCFVSPYPLDKTQSIWEADGSRKRKLTDEVTVGSEVFECPEKVFFGSSSTLIHSLTEMVSTTGVSNIVLAGKNTLFPGLAQRLQCECAFRGLTVQVDARPERGILAWQNASILFSTSHAQELASSKDFYDEYGPDVVEADWKAKQIY